MQYTRKLPIFWHIIALLLSSKVFGLNHDQLIQNICSNEQRFKHAITKYAQDTYGEPEKESEKAPTPISPTVECIFSANGDLQRLDSAYDHLTRGKIEDRKVSTGEVYSDWSFSEIDPRGQATIEPATKNSDSIFPLKHFGPFTYYNGSKNDVSVSVENQNIRLAWQDTETNQNVEGVYGLEGENLLPVEYTVVNPLPGGKHEIAVRLSYQYKDGSLSQLTICHPPHDIRISLTIRNIDFNPTFPPDHFDISFYEGTSVFDKSLNARYRYRKSFAMHSYFDEPFILGSSNHTVNEKENAPSELLSDESLSGDSTDRNDDIPSEQPSNQLSSQELDQVAQAFKSRLAETSEATNGHKISAIYLYGAGIIVVLLLIAGTHFLVKRKASNGHG